MGTGEAGARHPAAGAGARLPLHPRPGEHQGEPGPPCVGVGRGKEWDSEPPSAARQLAWGLWRRVSAPVRGDLPHVPCRQEGGWYPGLQNPLQHPGIAQPSFCTPLIPT